MNKNQATLILYCSTYEYIIRVNVIGLNLVQYKLAHFYCFCYCCSCEMCKVHFRIRALTSSKYRTVFDSFFFFIFCFLCFSPNSTFLCLCCFLQCTFHQNNKIGYYLVDDIINAVVVLLRFFLLLLLSVLYKRMCVCVYAQNFPDSRAHRIKVM